MDIKVFIQARMSSDRYSGKVLAPLNGVPLIKRVIDRVTGVISRKNIVVLTGKSDADDPLVSYMDLYEEIACFRCYGIEDNDVFGRFYKALEMCPCDWIIRVCGDSPLIDPRLIERTIYLINAYPQLDVFTNVFPFRTFPKGQSVEAVKVATFRRMARFVQSDEEREHVMPVFYHHPEKVAIWPWTNNGNWGIPDVDMAVDTVEDLHRIEKLMEEGVLR